MSPSLAYSSTFALGLLHAFEPGHGKTFLAAYLVGERLNFKHLFTLGFSLMFSHFFMLIVIAVILKFVFHGMSNNAVIESIAHIGPLLVILFGVALLIKYFVQTRKPPKHRHTHEHFDFKRPALTKTALVGAISGLLPCPTAIAPLLLSGIDSAFSNSLLYIFIYVAGMSIIMIVMIILFYFTKDALIKRFDFISAKLNPHLFSALLIIIVGFIYLGISGHVH